MRHIHMVASFGCWHSLTNNPHLDCPTLQNSVRVARARPNAGFWFIVQKWPVPESGGTSLAMKPCFDNKRCSNQGGRNSAGGISTSSSDSRKKEEPWMELLMCFCLWLHHHHHIYFHHHNGYTCSNLCRPDNIGVSMMWMPPQLIPRYTMRDSADLLHVQQQQHPQSQMPSQTYATYVMGPLQVSLSFRVESPTNSYVMHLVFVIVFAFCILVPM